MNYINLFIFLITHVRQLGGSGRGVLIVRNTPLLDITKMFDEFLTGDQIKTAFKFTKETDSNYPDMIIYRSENSDEHIVFGKNEQGWKGDYGLTHTDVVVSVH